MCVLPLYDFVIMQLSPLRMGDGEEGRGKEGEEKGRVVGRKKGKEREGRNEER